METLPEPPPPVEETPATPPSVELPPAYEKKVRRHARARRAFYRRGAVRSTAAIIFGTAFAVIVADIFFGLSERVRWSALGIFFITSWVLLSRWWWQPARAFGEAEAVREMERGFPELGQRLRTAREMEGDAFFGDRPLVNALMADTRRRVAAIEPRTLIPWRRLRIPLLACLVVLLGYLLAWRSWPEFQIGARRLATPWAGYSYTTVEIENPAATFIDRDAPHIVARVAGRAVTEAVLFTREAGSTEWKSVKMARAGESTRFDTVLAGRKKSFDFYVVAGDGRSPELHLRCLLTPKIDRAFAELTFPDYLGLPVKTTDGGDVRAVEGTKARVIFQLNTPLAVVSAATAEACLCRSFRRGGNSSSNGN